MSLGHPVYHSWLIHMCDMTHSRHGASTSATWLCFSRAGAPAYDSWLMRVCDMTHPWHLTLFRVSRSLSIIYMCDMGHESFMCDMGHESFMCVALVLGKRNSKTKLMVYNVGSSISWQRILWVGALCDMDHESFICVPCTQTTGVDIREGP